ncbi:MAG: hypothetical protein JXQ65_11810 [Candidatus Marinimicrobia bacterium]|nr:hypothetical protein [Candidatus Neomarinimicrobiota bacterium]
MKKKRSLNFQFNQKVLTCSQTLSASPTTIFPFLCPKREYDWIAPWSCHILYSKSGFAELDCVFSTDFPGDPHETWTIDRYEPDHLIQFIRFSESRIIHFKIELHEKKMEQPQQTGNNAEPFSHHWGNIEIIQLVYAN